MSYFDDEYTGATGDIDEGNYYPGDYAELYGDDEEEILTPEDEKNTIFRMRLLKNFNERNKLTDYKVAGDYNSFTDIKEKINTLNKKDIDMFASEYRRTVNLMNLKKPGITKNFIFNSINQMIKKTLASDYKRNRYLKSFMMSTLLNSCNLHRLIIPKQYSHITQAQTALRSNFFISNKDFLFHYFSGLKELKFEIPECNYHTVTFQSTLLNDNYTSDTLYTVRFKNVGVGNIQEKLNDQITILSKKIYEYDTIAKLHPLRVTHKTPYTQFANQNIRDNCYHCIRRKLIKKRKMYQICLNRLIPDPLMCKIVNNYTYFSYIPMLDDELFTYITTELRTIKRAEHYKLWSCFELITKQEHLDNTIRYKGKLSSTGCHRPVRHEMFEQGYKCFLSYEWPTAVSELKSLSILQHAYQKEWFVRGTLILRNKHVQQVQNVLKDFYIKKDIIGYAARKAREIENERARVLKAKNDELIRQQKEIEHLRLKKLAENKRKCDQVKIYFDQFAVVQRNRKALKETMIGKIEPIIKATIKSMLENYKDRIVPSTENKAKFRHLILSDENIYFKYITEKKLEKTFFSGIPEQIEELQVFLDALYKCLYLLSKKKPISFSIGRFLDAIEFFTEHYGICGSATLFSSTHPCSELYCNYPHLNNQASTPEALLKSLIECDTSGMPMNKTLEKIKQVYKTQFDALVKEYNYEKKIREKAERKKKGYLSTLVKHLC